MDGSLNVPSPLPFKTVVGTFSFSPEKKVSELFFWAPSPFGAGDTPSSSLLKGRVPFFSFLYLPLLLSRSGGLSIAWPPLFPLFLCTALRGKPPLLDSFKGRAGQRVPSLSSSLLALVGRSLIALFLYFFSPLSFPSLL